MASLLGLMMMMAEPRRGGVSGGEVCNLHAASPFSSRQIAPWKRKLNPTTELIANPDRRNASTRQPKSPLWKIITPWPRSPILPPSHVLAGAERRNKRDRNNHSNWGHWVVRRQNADLMIR